jgi:membrane protease YdiL (CAAX protease family)
MQLALDLAYVAAFALAWPIYEYFVGWPAFLRRLQGDPLGARTGAYRKTLVQQWLAVALGLVLWSSYGRSPVVLGLRWPQGAALWISAGVVALLVALYARQIWTIARDAQSRAQLRKHVEYIEKVLPHTTRELAWFLALSLTAGLCEEFLFRGVLITTLAPWLGWWGAASLGVVIFGLAHAYQGRGGVWRTGLVGLVMTLVVALTHSLVPAMALHALVDAASGLVTWIALRKAPATSEGAGAASA